MKNFFSTYYGLIHTGRANFLLFTLLLEFQTDPLFIVIVWNVTVLIEALWMVLEKVSALYLYCINTQGLKIFCEPGTLQHKTNDSTLKNITFYLQNENDGEVIFIGKTITFTFILIKIQVWADLIHFGFIDFFLFYKTLSKNISLKVIVLAVAIDLQLYLLTLIFAKQVGSQKLINVFKLLEQYQWLFVITPNKLKDLVISSIN